MGRRKDQEIYDYVASSTADEPTAYWKRDLDHVATATGLDFSQIRVRVHESARLRLRTTGAIGWHIVELIHAEPEFAVEETV